MQHSLHMNDLEGLPKTSWAGHVLLNVPLTLSQRALIESCVLFPVAIDRQPEDAFIIPLDFGKRALKGGGVDEHGFFQSHIVVDAYATAKHVQMEEADGKGESIWQVMGPEHTLSEPFRSGERALRMADALPVNETFAVRLSDQRIRNMTITAIIQNLQAIGVQPYTLEENRRVTQRHNVILPIGLPADDLSSQRAEETKKALETVKGDYTIEEFDTRSGTFTTWSISIIGIIPAPQPRGTHFAATKNLDGSAAITKKIITVIDIGGGDIYAYEVDTSSGTIAEPSWLGDGTISIAHVLVKLVGDVEGLRISEAEAQEALHSNKIFKAGEEFDISHLLAQLKPRYENLMTTVNISKRMLSTYIIFTGGGAALLHQEIRAKMQAMTGKHRENKDYVIIPASIAPIANCIGLFAIGYYKVQQVTRAIVTAYLQLLERQKRLSQNLTLLATQTDTEKESKHAREELLHVQQELSTHVGQYYKALQQQMLLEQQQATQQ